MARASQVLGMNARQSLYTRLNKARARKYSKSKLNAKKVLKKNDILVPEIYAKFKSSEEVDQFDFSTIDSSFVIKPSGGNAGKGILIVRRKDKKQEDVWYGVRGEKISIGDIKLHISDILEGIYTTYGMEHSAFVEERVPIHPKFKKYVYKGTPDIRVIVYNRVPVMAMLRLPVEESSGRANLHQGAIGVGIDIGTGITLKGMKQGKVIRYLPGTKRKLNGIKIPQWNKTLRTAVKAAEVSGLAYCGVDVLLHKDKGPMVVELNSNPGLSIQIANDDGLKHRLERIEGLKIRNVRHGVRVGKALFAEWFADKVKAKDGLLVLNTYEDVEVRADKKWHLLSAKVDTGAFRSAIDIREAEKLGLLEERNVLWGGKRKVVRVVYKVKGKKIVSASRIVDRERFKTKVILGRRDLGGFLVDPQLTLKDS